MVIFVIFFQLTVISYNFNMFFFLLLFLFQLTIIPYDFKVDSITVLKIFLGKYQYSIYLKHAA